MHAKKKEEEQTIRKTSKTFNSLELFHQCKFPNDEMAKAKNEREQFLYFFFILNHMKNQERKKANMVQSEKLENQVAEYILVLFFSLLFSPTN